MSTYINKQFLDSLKNCKIQDSTQNIAVFPLIFANFLKSFLVKFSTGHVVSLRFLPEKIESFKEDLSKCIKESNFDNLDNIILSFLESYHYKIPPYIVTIDFNDKAKKRFIEVCNNFKGRDWNSILDSFVDSLYDLFSTSVIQGGDLYLG